MLIIPCQTWNSITKSLNFCYLLHDERSLNAPATGLALHTDICLIQYHLDNKHVGEADHETHK